MNNIIMTRLAEIAREHDAAGRHAQADAIDDAMSRLAQSAIGSWWDGVKHVGQGLEDDAKAFGNAVAAPFESAAAAGQAAWNGGGLAYAPQAAGQAGAAIPSCGSAD